MSTITQPILPWLFAFRDHANFQFGIIMFIVDLFWSSKLDLSKVIYLTVYDRTDPLLGPDACSRTLERIIYILSAVIMALCQAAIVIRVWYLFARNVVIRTIAVATFAIAAVSTLVVSVLSTADIRLLLAPTPPTSIPETLMWIFIPSLIMHTILFTLKVYRLSQSPRVLHIEAPLRRFLKEGMLMYFLWDWRASTFHVDPEWLLNPTEMGRLQLRGGMSMTELCVDITDPRY
ncbi:hypothetical protein J3A83DRAFT_4428900 [Scleroderma citrinum]